MRHTPRVRKTEARKTGAICPYCGEPIDTFVDPSAGEDQNFIEDCASCCRPLRITAHYDTKERDFVANASREI
jgi:hypothetical protein